MNHIYCDRCGGNVVTKEEETWTFRICILCGRESKATARVTRRAKKQHAA